MKQRKKTTRKPSKKKVEAKESLEKASQQLQELSDKVAVVSEKPSRSLSNSEKIALVLVAVAAFAVGVTILS